MTFKNIIRRFKSVFVKEFRLANPSIDQYGKSESYKESFYDLVNTFQKKFGLNEKEGIKYAESILRERDKIQRETFKKEGKRISKYEALKKIREADIISDIDFDVINSGTP